MSRYSLTTRCATHEDAPVLAELWSDVVRRADRSEQIADVEQIIKNCLVSPEHRVVVVEYDGVIAGAVHLRMTTLTPLNLEPCVQAIQPRVFDQFRHRGVGHTLMDVATAFAEENGILHVVAAIPHASRDANRFMARLGLAPAAMYRIAPAAVVRARLSPQRVSASAEGRNKVLAARRSMRRARAERTVVAGSDGA